MSTAAQYPNREPFFAMKAIHTLYASGDAARIGRDAAALITVIAATEDATRYRGPVNFYNSQLQATLGIRKWETLDKARQCAVSAGWIVYSSQSTGHRSPGVYFVCIPTALEPKAYPEKGYGQGDEPSPAEGYGQPQAYPKSGEGQEKAYPPNGYGQPKASPSNGYAQQSPSPQAYPPNGYGRGEPPTLIPIPNTSPGKIPDEQTGRKGRKGKKTRVPTFTVEDLQTANAFWERIVTLQPDRKPPKFEAWAESIRLMRERDSRSHVAILDLLDRVQRDSFWRVNILSPDTLRSKWDDLSLKLKPATAPHRVVNAQPLPELRGIGS